MTARQMRVLAGSASALAAVVLALAGCAAASHPTANDVRRPVSRAAAAARAGTAVRLAAPLAKCADLLGAGRALGGAGGAPGATDQAGLVMLCEPVILHCPHGFRAISPGDLSGRRPPGLLRYRMVCIARFPLRTLPPEPRLTPMPDHTMPLNTLPPHTMPTQAAG